MSNLKYRQMAFQSVDGAVVGSFLEPLGQTKVMHIHMKFVLICLNCPKIQYLGTAKNDEDHTVPTKRIKYVGDGQHCLLMMSMRIQNSWQISCILSRYFQGK